MWTLSNCHTSVCERWPSVVPQENLYFLQRLFKITFHLWCQPQSPWLGELNRHVSENVLVQYHLTPRGEYSLGRTSALLFACHSSDVTVKWERCWTQLFYSPFTSSSLSVLEISSAAAVFPENFPLSLGKHFFFLPSSPIISCYVKVSTSPMASAMTGRE